MMPWIVLTVISLLFNLVQLIGNLVNGYYNLVYSGIFGFLIGFYIFIVVWSHRFLNNLASSQVLLSIFIQFLCAEFGPS